MQEVGREVRDGGQNRRGIGVSESVASSRLGAVELGGCWARGIARDQVSMLERPDSRTPAALAAVRGLGFYRIS